MVFLRRRSEESRKRIHGHIILRYTYSVVRSISDKRSVLCKRPVVHFHVWTACRDSPWAWRCVRKGSGPSESETAFNYVWPHRHITLYEFDQKNNEKQGPRSASATSRGAVFSSFLPRRKFWLRLCHGRVLTFISPNHRRARRLGCHLFSFSACPDGQGKIHIHSRLHTHVPHSAPRSFSWFYHVSPCSLSSAIRLTSLMFDRPA